jgi:hypothetical protein
MIIEDCKQKASDAEQRHQKDPVSLSLFKPSQFSTELKNVIKQYETGSLDHLPKNTF